MLDAIADFFSGQVLVEEGYEAWNGLCEIAVGLFTQSPVSLGGGELWKIISSLLISMKLIGASIFSLLYLINFCMKSTNLRDDRTVEMEVEIFIKLILGNLVLVNIDSILIAMIEIMQAMLGVVAPSGYDSLALDVASVEQWNNDSFLFGLAVGVVFFFVCIGGGLALILHVYTLFFKLFYYIVLSPLAMGTIAGPTGATRTAENWLKTFICCLMEFVGGIIMLRLCAVLINSNGFFISSPWDEFETIWNMIQGMLIILLTLKSVKTVDNLTRRAFGF